MINRKIKLPAEGSETFFLWGPRQTGKTTCLRESYPNAYWIDLLKSEEFRRYLQNPELLRLELAPKDTTPYVVIDEVQKLPALLDEVHWLIENKRVQFALCGSSARKVKKGHANLLGGRAMRYELYGLCAGELGSEWKLERMLNQGYLPRIYLSDSPSRMLSAYVADYLKEEIAAEGISRNLPVFSEFLNVASLSDGELVNFSNIARDCGVSSQTIKAYFGVLEDTLLGRWLPAYRKRPKRRVIGAPKFYFSDVGVVNMLARRGRLTPGSELFGKAFENWCFHELCCYNSYSSANASLSYWRLAGGLEVDFVVNHMELAIEAKASARITSDHLKGLRQLKVDHPEVQRRIIVCLTAKPYRTEDRIDVLPAHEFVRQLWNGDLFGAS